jgi:hypothetical protein
MGWADVALGGLDIVEVAVNPHSMLLEPYVKVLAAQLKERIAGHPPVAGNFDIIKFPVHDDLVSAND